MSKKIFSKSKKQSLTKKVSNLSQNNIMDKKFFSKVKNNKLIKKLLLFIENESIERKISKSFKI